MKQEVNGFFFFIKMEVFIDSIKIIIIFYFFKLNIYIGFCIILILLLFYMVIIIFIDQGLYIKFIILDEFED